MYCPLTSISMVSLIRAQLKNFNDITMNCPYCCRKIPPGRATCPCEVFRAKKIDSGEQKSAAESVGSGKPAEELKSTVQSVRPRKWDDPTPTISSGEQKSTVESVGSDKREDPSPKKIGSAEELKPKPTSRTVGSGKRKDPNSTLMKCPICCREIPPDRMKCPCEVFRSTKTKGSTPTQPKLKQKVQPTFRSVGSVKRDTPIPPMLKKCPNCCQEIPHEKATCPCKVFRSTLNREPDTTRERGNETLPCNKCGRRKSVGAERCECFKLEKPAECSDQLVHVPDPLFKDRAKSDSESEELVPVPDPLFKDRAKSSTQDIDFKPWASTPPAESDKVLQKTIAAATIQPPVGDREDAPSTGVSALKKGSKKSKKTKKQKTPSFWRCLKCNNKVHVQYEKCNCELSKTQRRRLNRKLAKAQSQEDPVSLNGPMSNNPDDIEYYLGQVSMGVKSEFIIGAEKQAVSIFDNISSAEVCEGEILSESNNDVSDKATKIEEPSSDRTVQGKRQPKFWPCPFCKRKVPEWLSSCHCRKRVDQGAQGQKGARGQRRGRGKGGIPLSGANLTCVGTPMENRASWECPKCGRWVPPNAPWCLCEADERIADERKLRIAAARLTEDLQTPSGIIVSSPAETQPSGHVIATKSLPGTPLSVGLPLAEKARIKTGPSPWVAPPLTLLGSHCRAPQMEISPGERIQYPENGSRPVPKEPAGPVAPEDPEKSLCEKCWAFVPKHAKLCSSCEKSLKRAQLGKKLGRLQCVESPYVQVSISILVNVFLKEPQNQMGATLASCCDYVNSTMNLDRPVEIKELHKFVSFNSKIEVANSGVQFWARLKKFGQHPISLGWCQKFLKENSSEGKNFAGEESKTEESSYLARSQTASTSASVSSHPEPDSTTGEIPYGSISRSPWDPNMSEGRFGSSSRSPWCPNMANMRESQNVSYDSTRRSWPPIWQQPQPLTAEPRVQAPIPMDLCDDEPVDPRFSEQANMQESQNVSYDPTQSCSPGCQHPHPLMADPMVMPMEPPQWVGPPPLPPGPPPVPPPLPLFMPQAMVGQMMEFTGFPESGYPLVNNVPGPQEEPTDGAVAEMQNLWDTIYGSD